MANDSKPEYYTAPQAGDFAETEEPFALFEAWFKDAVAHEPNDANAFALATVDGGLPNVRMVLLKGLDERGAVFYTNYESRKGRELAANPRGALVVYWDPLGRQVRIEGAVVPVAPAESDAYFRGRPRGSQIGAWASAQSRPIQARADLEARVAGLERRFEGEEVPRPPHWGGYRLEPASFEFWQHREDRLHDRLLYLPAAAGGWTVERLSP
jgi:pyridoxamine 5'-phosphate oxidase